MQVEYVRTWLLALALAAGPVAAQQAVPPKGGDPNLDLPRRVFEDLSTGRLRNDPNQAKLCDMCGKPLYQHGDPGFICEPLTRPVDPQTGRPLEIQRVEKLAVVCPACQTKFMVARRGNVNDRGGLDRDFCPHSVGKYAVHATVWMCPDCGFAAPPAGFEARAPALAAETVKYVREVLAPQTQKFMLAWTRIKPPKEAKYADFVEQTEIPDWVKYDHAVRLQELSGVKGPPMLLANLHLHAAHACRRFLASDVNVPGLAPFLLRTDRLIQAECRTVRRQRNEPGAGPLQTEVDASVLEEATRSLIVRARGAAIQPGARPPVADPEKKVTDRFMEGDLYLLYLRQAGFLDRLGQPAEARRALEQARIFIPSNLEGPPDVTALGERLIKLLQQAVEDRLTCLDLEQERLFRAAQNLTTALLLNEDPKRLEPVQHSYLTGELLRRSGRDPASAAAWFAAALTLVDAKTAEERTEPKWRGLRAWAAEQAELVKPQAAGKTASARTQEAVAAVLARGGANKTGVADVKKGPEPKAVEKPAGALKTRKEVYDLCFQAIKKYAEEKKASAPSVAALVAAGCLPAGAVQLNADGQLVCPESGKVLLYMQSTKLGDKNEPLLYPTYKDEKKATLYGDGHIGEQ